MKYERVTKGGSFASRHHALDRDGIRLVTLGCVLL